MYYINIAFWSTKHTKMGCEKVNASYFRLTSRIFTRERNFSEVDPMQSLDVLSSERNIIRTKMKVNKSLGTYYVMTYVYSITEPRLCLCTIVRMIYKLEWWDQKIIFVKGGVEEHSRRMQWLGFQVYLVAITCIFTACCILICRKTTTASAFLRHLFW